MPRKNPVLVKLMERRTVVKGELSKLAVELEWLNSVLAPPKAPAATPEAVTPPAEEPKGSARITAKDGLLWRDGKVIPLPEADSIAQGRGYPCAEQLVRVLCGETPNAANPGAAL